jgi:predicted transposase YdaD
MCKAIPYQHVAEKGKGELRGREEGETKKETKNTQLHTIRKGVFPFERR